MDWNSKHVKSFFKDNQKKYCLNVKHIQVLAHEEVFGHVFLALTREGLHGDPFHLADGMARAIIDSLKTTG